MQIFLAISLVKKSGIICPLKLEHSTFKWVGNIIFDSEHYEDIIGYVLKTYLDDKVKQLLLDIWLRKFWKNFKIIPKT